LRQTGKKSRFVKGAGLRHGDKLVTPLAGDAGMAIVFDQPAGFGNLGGAFLPQAR
jgi:hypothetical protein